MTHILAAIVQAYHRAGRDINREAEYRLALTFGDPDRLLLLDEFRHTRELAWRYLEQHGGEGPLGQAIGIDGRPILRPGVLTALATELGLSQLEAAQFWAAMAAACLPYLHSPMPEATVGDPE